MYANVAYGKVCFLADPDCDIGIGEANTGKPGGGGSDPTPDNKTYCRDEPDYTNGFLQADVVAHENMSWRVVMM